MTLQNQIVPATGATLPYDARKDLQGVVLFGKTASVLTVHTSLPIKSVPELIAYAKANPGKLAFATSGNATGQHFATESLKLGAGIDIVHVPYKGVAPAYTDVLAGRVPVMFMTYGSGKQHWESGKVRPLAVSTPTRFDLMPELPTMAEASGIKDFSLIEWYALVAPGSMPREAKQKLHAALAKLMSRPEHADFNRRYGLVYDNLTVEQTQDFLDKELERMTVIARRANIKLE
jgi:tripartite-type tricarboxylate transporter receptor subunit TctC